MSGAELADALRPIRLPEDFARFGVQDAMAAMALGLVIGVVLALLLQRALVRRSDPVAEVRAEIARLAAGSEAARLFGLVHHLARLDPNGRYRPDGLDQALYDPAVRYDTALLEAALIAAARDTRISR